MKFLISTKQIAYIASPVPYKLIVQKSHFFSIFFKKPVKKAFIDRIKTEGLYVFPYKIRHSDKEMHSICCYIDLFVLCNTNYTHANKNISFIPSAFFLFTRYAWICFLFIYLMLGNEFFLF